jgi:hypothetical protein
VSLVKWKEYTQEENTWETYKNIAEHDMGLLREHYKRNPVVETDGRFKDLGKGIRI